MKRFLKLGLVALMITALALAAAGCGGQKQEQEPAGTDGKQKVVFASDTAYAPFEFQTDKGLEGFDIDLLKAIEEVSDLEIEVRGMNFDGIVPALETASVDAAISAMTITDKRKQSVNFSLPYYLSGQSVAVRADNTDIQGFEDLEGKKLGVQISTTGADEARTVPNAEVIDYNTINEAFMALRSGAVDAVVNDFPVSAYFIQQNPNVAKIVGDLKTSEHYGMAFPKKNTELLEKVNQALETLKENGKFAEIYMKWFGVEPPDYLPGEPPAN